MSRILIDPSDMGAVLVDEASLDILISKIIDILADYKDWTCDCKKCPLDENCWSYERKSKSPENCGDKIKDYVIFNK